MCGRYTIKTSKNQIEEEFAAQVAEPDLIRARFNIAPTQTVPVVLEQDGRRIIDGLRWGLIPSWAKDEKIGSKMINARGETVAEKPSFRTAFKKRRCIIPASGFYEWQALPSGPKQPHYFYPADGGLFAFAGLWEEWLNRETGELVGSCTIITTAANELLATMHDRMPVILKHDSFDEWLSELNHDTAGLARLITQFDAGAMRAYTVSRAVNSVKNDGPELVQPAA